MPTIPSFTIPANAAVTFARMFGVIKGEGEDVDPNETDTQAWTRTLKELKQDLKNKYKREVAKIAAQSATGDLDITETD